MIDRDEILLRACRALVGLFQDQIEGGIECVHTRIFNYIIHPEIDYVHCGISAEAKSGAPTHPEHVVPCAVLVREAFRLIQVGNLGDEEIAKLLQRHWKIATISKGEARRLDSELKLKSTMPEDWNLESGDTYARFNLAGIVLE